MGWQALAGLEVVRSLGVGRTRCQTLVTEDSVVEDRYCRLLRVVEAEIVAGGRHGVRQTTNAPSPRARPARPYRTTGWAVDIPRLELATVE